MAGGVTPAQRKHPIDDLLNPVFRTITQGREVRQQSDIPKQQRDRPVGGHGEDVPDQRAAELWPDAHGTGVRKHVVAIHGRPVWMSGKIPAQATAKSVMASAKRLIEVRHFWLSRKRIAEMSVPA